MRRTASASAGGKDNRPAGQVAVMLVERDLEHARQLLSKIVRAADRRQILEGAYAIDGSGAESGREDPHEALALQLFAVQQARGRLLPPTASSELAWDILVTLYLADRSAARHTIGQVVKMTRCSLATGLRHIAALQQEGLIEREPSKSDGRVFHLRISAKGRKAVEAVLSTAIPAHEA